MFANDSTVMSRKTTSGSAKFCTHGHLRRSLNLMKVAKGASGTRRRAKDEGIRKVLCRSLVCSIKKSDA